MSSYKILLGLLFIFHGFIHCIGFAKAFGYSPITQISKEITKPIGLMALMAALLFISAAILFFSGKDWEWVSLIAMFVSQIFIMLTWKDAKWGTLANFVILIFAILSLASKGFENQYKKSVQTRLEMNFPEKPGIDENNSLLILPTIVQRYIEKSGTLDQPHIRNFKLIFEGRIRKALSSEWMPFTTEQYNFMKNPTRLFFMKATMKGFPVSGFHHYRNSHAVMDIRLLSLIPVQYMQGKEMDISELVTWFNDLCIFAPAALTDKRIRWAEKDSLTVKAIFTHGAHSISATLVFNENAELINFISDDRYAYSGHQLKKTTWSTPLKAYKKYGQFLISSGGDACYHDQDGDLCYGEFRLQKIEYNVTE
ncbi:MAG: hypothetical protein GC171_11025 [Terrimonas sp.]|nr:hypothetical protein [Terrimonas sp.]